jgi:hypothetical protein
VEALSADDFLEIASILHPSLSKSVLTQWFFINMDTPALLGNSIFGTYFDGVN